MGHHLGKRTPIPKPPIQAVGRTPIQVESIRDTNGIAFIRTRNVIQPEFVFPENGSRSITYEGYGCVRSIEDEAHFKDIVDDDNIADIQQKY